MEYNYSIDGLTREQWDNIIKYIEESREPVEFNPCEFMSAKTKEMFDELMSDYLKDKIKYK